VIQGVELCASQDFTFYLKRDADFIPALQMARLARLYIFHILNKTNEANLGGWTSVKVISHF